jgi:taurine--2-oxoglutarate transaminase
MPKVISKLKENGFSTYSHENIIIVAPPLTINEAELREAMKILDDTLKYVDEICLK